VQFRPVPIASGPSHKDNVGIEGITEKNDRATAYTKNTHATDRKTNKNQPTIQDVYSHISRQAV
jgi:hypothetical protein